MSWDTDGRVLPFDAADGGSMTGSAAARDRRTFDAVTWVPGRDHGHRVGNWTNRDERRAVLTGTRTVGRGSTHRVVAGAYVGEARGRRRRRVRRGPSDEVSRKGGGKPMISSPRFDALGRTRALDATRDRRHAPRFNRASTLGEAMATPRYGPHLYSLAPFERGAWRSPGVRRRTHNYVVEHCELGWRRSGACADEQAAGRSGC